MKKIFIASTLGVLIFFLWWHLRLGLTRYFDVDEFAYLHWAYNVFSGKIPYRDFFFYIPPGFLWFLAPMFAFFGGVAPILAGRVVAFSVFAALCAVSAILFWQVRKSWVAILAAVFLAFLPIPFDKLLEIRPDTLAMLLVMLGLLFQVRKENFLAGLLYGLSLLVLPKTLPQVLVGVLFARSKGFFAGLFLPWAVFGLWALSTGDSGSVWYSIMQLPKEVGVETARMFPMQPDLFFYPNATYYGENGWSVGLIVNHLLWAIGLGMGAIRLLVPKNKTEFVIAASLFSHVIFFFWIYPQRHAQYLIPIAVFVAWYVADFVNIIWKKAGIIYLFGLIGLVFVFVRVNGPKVAWDNKESLATIENIQKTIPTSEYLLDLDGRTLYYQDPYYICCLPFGEFTRFMSKQPPSLLEALEKTKTNYIFQGQLERTKTLLQEDQAYIQRYFLPIAPGNPQLLVRKN